MGRVSALYPAALIAGSLLAAGPASAADSLGLFFLKIPTDSSAPIRPGVAFLMNDEGTIEPDAALTTLHGERVLSASERDDDALSYSQTRRLRFTPDLTPPARGLEGFLSSTEPEFFLESFNDELLLQSIAERFADRVPAARSRAGGP